MNETTIDDVIDDIHVHARDSIQTLRDAVRDAPPARIGDLLAHAVDVLREIESIELRLELARIAEDAEDAREHALDARSLAVALSEAVARLRVRAVAEVPE